VNVQGSKLRSTSSRSPKRRESFGLKKPEPVMMRHGQSCTVIGFISCVLNRDLHSLLMDSFAVCRTASLSILRETGQMFCVSLTKSTGLIGDGQR